MKESLSERFHQVVISRGMAISVGEKALLVVLSCIPLRPVP